MVKFGRKFFFDTKHSKKRKIITYVIAGVVILFLIILLALIIRAVKKKKPSKPKTNKTEIVLRTEIDAELYSVLPDKTAYFEKLENFDINNIKITYPSYLPLDPVYDNCSDDELKIIEEIRNGKNEDDYKDPYACVSYMPTGIGAYDVTVNYNDTDYTVTLNVVDTKSPTLVVKNLEITEGDTYEAKDFVESCVDNSQKECNYEFYDKDYSSGKDYGNLTEPGTYNISIIALDGSGNITVPENTTLIIKEKPEIKIYTITFNTDGGSVVNAQYVSENEKAQVPANPTKSGYTFAGWYSGDNKFDFNTAITGDMTLKAKWTKNAEKKPSTKPSTSTCQNGDLKYNTDKYPFVALFVSNGNCAISKSDLNLKTYGAKTSTIINNEYKKLQEWEKEKGVDYCIALVNNGPQGVLNNSGKGYIGYTIQFTIVTADIDYTTKECKNLGAEVARYYLDQNGKRHFSLNTINLPES